MFCVLSVESRYDEFCNLDEQCQRIDRNTKCHHDLNVCRCKPRYQVQNFNKGSWCMGEFEDFIYTTAETMAITYTRILNPFYSVPEHTSNNNGGAGSYYDPALFGIMGGLALMFIVMCVVLQLFAK